jgi:hypothetical protein
MANLQTFFSEGDARQFGITGRLRDPRVYYMVPVSLNHDALEAHFTTTCAQLDALLPTNWELEHPSFEILFEYLSDVLAIRIRDCQEDLGFGFDQVPRGPSRGIKNSLEGLPLWTNFFAAVGYVAVNAEGYTLIPSMEWDRDDSGRLRRIEEPRHRDLIDFWLRRLVAAHVAMPTKLLASGKDGTQAVMLSYWYDEVMTSPLVPLDHNSAYMASFVMNEGLPDRFYPLVKYWTRGELRSIIREVTRRDSNLRRPESRRTQPQPKSESEEKPTETSSAVPQSESGANEAGSSQGGSESQSA